MDRHSYFRPSIFYNDFRPAWAFVDEFHGAPPARPTGFYRYAEQTHETGMKAAFSRMRSKRRKVSL